MLAKHKKEVMFLALFARSALTWISVGFFSRQFVASLPNIRSNVGNKVIPPSNVNMEAVVRTIWGRLAKMKTNALFGSNWDCWFTQGC